MASKRRHESSRVLLAIALVGLSFACAGTRELEIEGAFPVPLIDKVPVDMGIHLDDELLGYEHKEKIENRGEWIVPLGPIQPSLFESLGSGLFRAHVFTDGLLPEDPDPTIAHLDGVLKPRINQVQFSLPEQTRSNYYEVWIKYQFQLFDRAGNLVSQWDLPAYGKASNQNYGSSTSGLKAAATAACRDAMAFFSINFSRQPDIRKWIADGTPLVPAAPTVAPSSPPSQPAADAPEQQTTESDNSTTTTAQQETEPA